MLIPSRQSIKQFRSTKNLLRLVFSKLSNTATAKFDHTELERLIKDAMTHSPLNLIKDVPLADENICKTFVFSVTTRSAGIPELIPTYNTSTADASEAKIW